MSGVSLVQHALRHMNPMRGDQHHEALSSLRHLMRRGTNACRAVRRATAPILQHLQAANCSLWSARQHTLQLAHGKQLLWAPAWHDSFWAAHAPISERIKLVCGTAWQSRMTAPKAQPLQPNCRLPAMPEGLAAQAAADSCISSLQPFSSLPSSSYRIWLCHSCTGKCCTMSTITHTEEQHKRNPDEKLTLAVVGERRTAKSTQARSCQGLAAQQEHRSRRTY